MLASVRRRRVLIVALTALMAVAAIVVSAVIQPSGAPAAPTPIAATPPPAQAPGATPARPNIVFVLTDDLSWNLVQYMPHVVALQQRGMTFVNYTVTDSLCCPSRASIFTGDFPHDTHVTTNTMPDGGFTRFTQDGDDKSTFATSLHAAGYDTGFFGKYLNLYNPYVDSTRAGAYVPPGWTQFDAVNQGGYASYGYAISSNHDVQRYGTAPKDYVTSVLQQRSNQFVDASVAAGRPFLAEVATFAPHFPYVPAPQDENTITALREPHSPAYARLPADAPAWLAAHGPLLPQQKARMNLIFDKRVEDVQSVDRMIGSLERNLQRLGQLKNTIFVFSSDNGFHLGEYDLTAGKQTAFDTDVNVPLIVAGPGIRSGSTDNHIVENIDLRPTFDQLAGGRTPANVDGHSLVALLHGKNPPWRTVAGIEHQGPELVGNDPGDPDAQTFSSGIPPSYDAVRTARYTYVRYKDGEREFYDRQSDPYELHNLAGSMTAQQKAYFNGLIAKLSTCHGTQACWAAARPAV